MMVNRSWSKLGIGISVFMRNKEVIGATLKHSPLPDHFNLDECIQEVGERISQLHEKNQPVPEAISQGTPHVEITGHGSKER